MIHEYVKSAGTESLCIGAEIGWQYYTIMCVSPYLPLASFHYCDVIMGAMASLITSLTIVYSSVYSGADQRKHQSPASLAFVQGIHRDRWIPRTNDKQRGKCFHLMTSSCSLSFLGVANTGDISLNHFAPRLELLLFDMGDIMKSISTCYICILWTYSVFTREFCYHDFDNGVLYKKWSDRGMLFWWSVYINTTKPLI